MPGENLRVLGSEFETFKSDDDFKWVLQLWNTVLEMMETTGAIKT